MSSLAQLADLLTDAPLMERVRMFYTRGLWEIRDELGWVIESSLPDALPDFGEANNTGDILETALILGRWGYPEAYDDAERILRGHLLPSQLRDVSWISGAVRVRCGWRRAPRCDPSDTGVAYGFPAPYGHRPVEASRISFNMDVVGGAVASLCEAYRDATRHDAAGHWVNLLFDHQTEAIEVESPYPGGVLGVTLKRPGPLFVRVPAWADLDGVAVRGATAPRGRARGDIWSWPSRPSVSASPSRSIRRIARSSCGTARVTFGSACAATPSRPWTTSART